MENVKQVRHYQKRIEQAKIQNNFQEVLHCLKRLQNLPVGLNVLEVTGIGKTVNSCRKIDGDISDYATLLVATWKRAVKDEIVEEPDSQNESGSEHSGAIDDTDDVNNGAPDLGQKKSDTEGVVPDIKFVENSISNDARDSSCSKTRKSVKDDTSSAKHKRTCTSSSKKITDYAPKGHHKIKINVVRENSKSRSKEKNDSKKQKTILGSPLIEFQINAETDDISESVRMCIDNMNEFVEEKCSEPDVECDIANSQDNDVTFSPNSDFGTAANCDDFDKEDEMNSLTNDIDYDGIRGLNCSESFDNIDIHYDPNDNDEIVFDQTKKSKFNVSSHREKSSSSSHHSSKKQSHKKPRSDKEKHNRNLNYEKHSNDESKHERHSKHKDHSSKKSKHNSNHDGDHSSKPKDRSKSQHSRSSNDNRTDKDRSKSQHSRSSNDNQTDKERLKSHRSISSSSNDKKRDEKRLKSHTRSSENRELSQNGKVRLNGINEVDIFNPCSSKYDGIDVPKIKLESNTSTDGSFDNVLLQLSAASPSPKKKKSRTATSSPASCVTNSSEMELLSDNVLLDPLDIDVSGLSYDKNYEYSVHNTRDKKNGATTSSVSENDALISIMTTKNLKTKVFSGGKSKLVNKVATLFDMCVRILQENIDSIEYTGGIPYLVIKPVLERATADQLTVFEHYNPYILVDSDELWEFHVKKDFRKAVRQEYECWREIYQRCKKEQEEKLQALKENISLSRANSEPVRKSVLLHSYVKPPRDVVKKQAMNGIISASSSSSVGKKKHSDEPQLSDSNIQSVKERLTSKFSLPSTSQGSSKSSLIRKKIRTEETEDETWSPPNRLQIYGSDYSLRPKSKKETSSVDAESASIDEGN